MFSKRQKIEISKKVEEILLSYDHPEMPKEKPIFELHVNGKEDWSWANIKPNHLFEDTEPDINDHNESQDPLSKEEQSQT